MFLQQLPQELQDLCFSSESISFKFSVVHPPCFLISFIKYWLGRALLAIVYFLSFRPSAPPGFPCSGNGLWFTKPGSIWSKEFLPIGNGYLAAMIPGGTAQEIIQLNIESLWSGGPFADPSYNGGNKQPTERAATAHNMQTIRQTIFQCPTGDIDNIELLATDAGAYGSYAGAGHLISTISSTGTVSKYGRWLDLDQAIARTTWTQDGTTYMREAFCSHTTQSCTQRTTSTASTALSLPNMTYTFSSSLEAGLPTPNITCLDPSTLLVRGNVANPGMLYEILGRVYSTGGTVTCRAMPTVGPVGTPQNASILVSGATEAWITWVGGTEYFQDAGDSSHNFSFRGPDPHASLVTLLSNPLIPTCSTMLLQHIADYNSTFSSFSLSLGQTPQLDAPTDVLKAEYKTDVGNVYLEWLLFNYGRYLLWSSARGALPANLQGKWGDQIRNSWGADYHSNINIQMNYWSAEMSNLDVTKSLFDYFEKNWAPRGAQTANILYNITRGWVTHNEMNIFGHTGMKGGGNTALWANYPEAAVWMMIHVWDHFDHTNDVAWWKAQGWPLIKGVTSFHLDKLIPDLHFNDSTLVVSPCNSPEQVPITFGCAHAQQMVWQLFNAVEKGFAVSGDTDAAFLEEVKAKRAKMDKGLRIGSWGQLQEWKVDRDSPTDTHRHLSHLIGLYPGYAISSYDTSLQENLLVNGTTTAYTKGQVIDAAKVSLIHRGNGTGPDANAGWEKMWRAASWAQLGETEEFYHILTHSIFGDFGPNLFSLYNSSQSNPIFQIDANLGYPAAVLNALLQAPDVPTLSIPLTITLLPALPRQWSSGAIKGARVRGGITLDLQWSGGKPRNATLNVDANARSRPVQVVYGGKVLSSFTTTGGLSKGVLNYWGVSNTSVTKTRSYD